MKNMFNGLQKKKVLLIGAFGLIGSALTRSFSKVTNNLIVADINNKYLDKSGKFEFLKFDMRNKKKYSNFLNQIIKKNKKIDVFVNCSFTATKDWLDKPEIAKYESVLTNLDYHLGSYYELTRLVALHMKSQKSGSIINFGSTYGLVAPTFSIYEKNNLTSPAVYGLCKGGINQMTKYFASYFGKYNVRVNSIVPGGVYNNQDPTFVKNYEKLTPLQRMAQPDDFVGPALFLASDYSSYVTGHNLVVDGGWTIH